MDAAQPSYPPSTPPATRQPVRPRNGLGVAALVIGVGSLVAAVSFLLFPLALIGGIVGAILGAIGIARANAGRANNQGQAAAGLACPRTDNPRTSRCCVRPAARRGDAGARGRPLPCRWQR